MPVLALLASLLVALAPSPGEASTPSVTQVPAASKPAVVQARARAKDPRRTRGLFVDSYMKAAQAGPAFKRIGARAQPLWITDYYKKPIDAKNAVKGYVTRAKQAHKTPLLVIYNIPDRDCGMYSAQQQQINDRYYRSWVAKAASGISGSKPIVILEPDALPFIDNPSCSGKGNRLASLKYAVKKLTRAGAWVYLDAGHSGWHTAAHMAPLLRKAGVASARGFATNVANSRATPDERTFERQIVKELKKRKVSNVHYVLDTSRNGAGRKGPANGDVCNPTTARLGAAPRLTFKGSYDGNLWVKLPGESDGPCNGGPSSGDFFPTGACRLLKGASAYYDEGSGACRT